jgi:hypothetical protein
MSQEDKIKQLHEAYGVEEKPEEKSPTQISVEKMQQLWNQSHEQSQGTGCAPLILQWWWKLWYGNSSRD